MVFSVSYNYTKKLHTYEDRVIRSAFRTFLKLICNNEYLDFQIHQSLIEYKQWLHGRRGRLFLCQNLDDIIVFVTFLSSYF